MRSTKAVFLVLLALCGASCLPAKPSNPTGPEADLYKQADERAQEISERLRAAGMRRSRPDAAVLEAQEDQNRQRAIQNYRALLAEPEALDPSVLESALLNLAHLTFENCLARHRKDMQKYEENYRNFQLGHTTVRPEAPRYDFREAKALYQQFLDRYPDSPSRPEVLYNLAYAYGEEGDLDRSVELFGEIALNFPGVRFAPEAYLRLGEHHFELNEFDRAEQYYKKVLELGETPLYEKALFKLGWCAYAQQDIEQAQERFARLLDLNSSQGRNKPGDLYRESIEVLAKILAEQGAARALDSFLRERRNPGYGVELALQLGDYLRETSRFQDAIETYQRILTAFPNDARAPFVEKSLIESLRLENRSTEAEAREAALVDRYGQGTPWDAANPDPDLRSRVDALIREILTSQIVAHHRQARERKDSAEYDKAIQLYENYLRYFPDDQAAYENRFRLAECLFESGRLDRAAAEYDKVAREERFLEYRGKASLRRIQCLEMLRARNQVELDALVAAYRDYVEQNPADEQARTFLFKQGEILFNAARYLEAAAAFERILQADPAGSRAVRAWMLIVEAYFAAGQYPEVAAWTERILDRDLPLSNEQRRRIQQVRALARFEVARRNEQEGKWSEAAEQYRVLAEESPDSPVAPDALFNAALCYEKTNDRPTATACLERIVSQYPESKHAGNALVLPLPYYEETGQWDRILDHLGRMYQRDPQDPVARENLYKLAKKLRNKGEEDRAREVFALYAKRYPQDSVRTLEIAYTLAEMDEERGAASEALAGYRRFLETYERLIKSDPTLTVDPASLSKAQYRVLDPLFEEYRDVRLVEPLKTNLARKQKLMDRLVEGYVKTARYGSGESSTASAFRIGEIYEDFARSLLESPVPRDLTPEEVPIYRELLEQQASPFREKALAAYRVTLEKAREKGILNRWVLASYDRLSAMDPAAYPSLLEDSPVPWVERWSEKRSLVRSIEWSPSRSFSKGKAKTFQDRLDQILKTLQKPVPGDNLESRKLEEAAQGFAELLTKEPTLYEVHFNLAVLSHMLGDKASARREYEIALQQNPNIGFAHLNLAVLDFEQGDPKSASAHLEELVRLSPEYAGAHYMLGVAKARIGDGSGAAASFERAASLLPQFLDPHVELADLLFRAGSPEKSMDHVRLVLDHPKAGARVLRKLAAVLLAQNRLDEAVEACSRALESREAGYEDWNNRAVAFLRKGLLQEAEADLLEAVAQGPNRPEAWNNLGIVHAYRKAFREALSAFLEAEHKDRAFAPALLNAAVIYGEYLGDTENMTNYLSRYLEKGGTHQRDLLQAWLGAARGQARSAPGTFEEQTSDCN